MAAHDDTVEKLKTYLRISHSALDEDISDHVDACLADLKTTIGVNVSETDPLILYALKLYIRANMMDDTAKAEAYLKRYDALKASLQLAAYEGDDDDSDD